MRYTGLSQIRLLRRSQKIYQEHFKNNDLSLHPAFSSPLINTLAKRHAHFTYTPDPTDTTKGKTFLLEIHLGGLNELKIIPEQIVMNINVCFAR